MEYCFLKGNSVILIRDPLLVSRRAVCTWDKISLILLVWFLYNFVAVVKLLMVVMMFPGFLQLMVLDINGSGYY